MVELEEDSENSSKGGEWEAFICFFTRNEWVSPDKRVVWGVVVGTDKTTAWERSQYLLQPEKFSGLSLSRQSFLAADGSHWNRAGNKFATAGLIPAEPFAMGWCRCKKFIWAQRETGQITRRNPVSIFTKLIITGSRNTLGCKWYCKNLEKRYTCPVAVSA